MAQEKKDPRTLEREKRMAAKKKSVEEWRETQAEMEKVLRNELAELKKTVFTYINSCQ